MKRSEKKIRAKNITPSEALTHAGVYATKIRSICGAHLERVKKCRVI